MPWYSSCLTVENVSQSVATITRCVALLLLAYCNVCVALRRRTRTEVLEADVLPLFQPQSMLHPACPLPLFFFHCETELV